MHQEAIAISARRRSPQAYRDDPRNARKRTQESRRRTQSCNFYRICVSLAVPYDRTKRLAKKKRRSSSLPLPKRLAYPVKIASEPSIRKPQHGIGQKDWTARRVRWNPSAPRQSGEASTGEAGRQGRMQRPPGKRVLPVAFSQTRIGRRMGDDRDKFRSAKVLSRKREQAAGEAACSRTSETRRTSVSLKHTLHGQLSFVKNNILRKDFSPVPFA